jgi:DNA-binding MarR family transcriptional regulator
MDGEGRLGDGVDVERTGRLTPASLAGIHDLPRLLERLHRRFLDVVRIELERLQSAHVTPVQGLMLLTIGDSSPTVQELIERGHYLGAAAAGNLRALVQAGLVQGPGPQDDRRSARLCLTDAGMALCRELRRVEMGHVLALARDGEGEADLLAAYRLLDRLEQSWADVIRADAIDAGPVLAGGEV